MSLRVVDNPRFVLAEHRHMGTVYIVARCTCDAGETVSGSFFEENEEWMRGPVTDAVVEAMEKHLAEDGK